MVYIRIKKINNKHYAYLVENKITQNGPRQKVKQYLGKVYEFENIYNIDNSNIKQNSKQNIISYLAASELMNKGFKEKENNYIYQNFVFSPKKLSLIKKTKSKINKEIIISLNEGYLCSFTLQRLLNFKKSKNFDKDAYNLAKYFLEAGIPISEELFIKFYQKL